MGIKNKIIITMLVLYSPVNVSTPKYNASKLETNIKSPQIRSDKPFELVDSIEELIEGKGNAYIISREDLVNELSEIFDRKEFILNYSEERKLLVNICLESEIDRAVGDTAILRYFGSEKRMRLIHNHNDIDRINSDEIPLYYVGPSPEDINFYFIIGKIYPQIDFSIISKQGMLTLNTEIETFNDYQNPIFKDMPYDEAKSIQNSLTGITKDSLTLWAENYRGIVWLSFEPITAHKYKDSK